MADTKVIVFTTNTAVVLTNLANIAQLKTTSNVLVNADMSKLPGVSKHFWKLVDGKIVAMTQAERLARTKNRKTNSADLDCTAALAAAAAATKN
jgi:hypothetical protein